ncbi:MAG: hypothetical protein CMG71_07540 [Candidatus Marinimicrobia bacterium]|nr:hypothetical protein [Candidatus Neomarinimicrobiota bacterium]
MRILSAEGARKVDRIAMEELDVAGTALMELAGSAVADKAVAMSNGGRIGVICGKGNNGGDGYACAAALKTMGIETEVISPEPADSLTGDSKHFYAFCQELHLDISHGVAVHEVDLNVFDLLVDGLLGIGITGEVRPQSAAWIKTINDAKAKRLSIDIPSGVNATSGSVHGAAVQADSTVTMGFMKQGLILQPGRSMSGDVTVADLGYPEKAFAGQTFNKRLIGQQFVKDSLTAPESHTYKHRQGKLLIIAGSRGFTGAAILCANAAMRSGSGLVLCAVPESLNIVFEKQLQEPMTLPLPDSGRGFLDDAAFPLIAEKMEWCDAILIGPGLGTDVAVAPLLKRVLQESRKPTLIDADAITHIIEEHSIFESMNCPFVLTPHHGEASRLFDVPQDEITSDPFSFAGEAAENTGGVIVLKGAPTLTAFQHEVVANSTGHQGLASGGTGDVLAGIIGSFLSQGMSLETAAQVGVYLHGKCADRLLYNKGYRGLIASDLIETIPSIISEYETS